MSKGRDEKDGGSVGAPAPGASVAVDPAPPPAPAAAPWRLAWRPSAWRLSRLAVVLVAALNVALAFEVAENRESKLHDMESLLSAMNGASADRIADMLEKTDGLLVAFARAADDAALRTYEISTRMQGMAAAHGEIAHLFVLDGEGEMILDLSPMPPERQERQASDAAEVAWWRANPQSKAPHVSPAPAAEGAARIRPEESADAGRGPGAAFRLSRPHFAPDGSVDGVVVAGLRGEAFSGALEMTRTAWASGQAKLRGSDALEPVSAAPGAPAASSAEGQAPPRAGAFRRAGFHVDVVGSGDGTRLVGTASVHGQELVLENSMSMDEALGPWYDEVWETLAVAVVMSLAIFSIAFVGDRREAARLGLVRKLERQRDALDEAVVERTRELLERTEDLAASNQEWMESEERVRLVLESTEEGIYGIDVKGVCTIANPAAARMLGLGSVSGMLGQDLHGLFHHHRRDGSEYPAAECPAAVCAAKGTAALIDDEIFFRPDGTWFDVQYRVNPMHRNGTLSGAVVVFSDITERRRAEEAMRVAHTVFETAGEGIMVTDADNRITAVNPAFLRITGYEIADVLGRRPDLLASGRHGPEFYSEMWRTLSDVGSWQGEIWNRRKDGVIYAEWLTITMIRGGDGRPRQYVAVFSDITSRARAAEKSRHEADYDALTDLPNRRLFKRRFEKLLQSAEAEGRRLALLYVDLDRFKPVNDALGHAAGDRLLMEVAVRLKSRVELADMVARLGGDEFAVVLSSVGSLQHASIVAAEIVAEMARPFRIEDSTATIGASVGVAVYPEDGCAAESLMRSADAAMYEAKSSGRSCVKLAAHGRKPVGDAAGGN